MCQIKAKVVDGPVETEKIVYIDTTCGTTVEVFVPSSRVRGETLEVTEIARDGGNVLVELPEESTTGDWRLWVGKGLVMG